MTKTKRAILYLAIPVLAALIALPFRTEQYGNNYNEQQRKIWNTQMEADPEDHLLTDFPRHYQGDDPRIKEIIERNNNVSEQLRNRAAPDWDVSPPSSPDFSKLPPEGMTFDELLHRAENNQDPDAWLLLLSTSKTLRFDTPLAKYQLQLMRKWVSKAHELKRPGTDFLLRAIDQRENTLATQYDSRENPVNVLEKTPGFSDFKRLIDSGDFALYKALVVIWPNVHRTSMGSKLEAMLENKARQSDVIAQRQLGEYGFMSINGARLIISREKQEPRNGWIIWLSEQAEKWCPNLISISKTMDTSPTRDKLDKYAAWLKKAADAGDLAAMSLWLEYGIETLNRYSKNEWEDILRYSNILINVGHEQTHPDMIGPRLSNILWCSYSTHSRDRLMSNCEKSLFIRGSEWATRNELMENILHNTWDTNPREYNLELLDKAARQNPGMLIEDFWSPSSFFIGEIKDPIVKQRFIDIIRKEADDGDPFFMEALAYMIQNKMANPKDPGEPIRLLEQAWPLCPKYNFCLSISTQGVYSHDVHIVDMLMELYLMDFPSPENQQKAFQLAHQYLLSDGGHCTGKEYCRKLAYFYLSLMHQKGYGTPKNDEKAQHYYQELQKIRLPNFFHIEKKIEALSKKFDYNIP